MSEDYPWYTIVGADEPLQQGDLLPSCPIAIPPKTIMEGVISVEGEEPAESKEPIEIEEFDVVVMSQSCDLIAKKVDIVTLCPYWPLEDIRVFKGQRKRENLRQGKVFGCHLLNKCEIEGFKTDFLVVDFKSVYGLPIDFIFEFVKRLPQRVRLLPPYREHLAQAFARLFMRVGLPVDIPVFK